MSTFTNLLFHIVFSTKYRKPTIELAWQDQLYGYVGGIIRENKGTPLCMGEPAIMSICWQSSVQRLRFQTCFD